MSERVATERSDHIAYEKSRPVDSTNPTVPPGLRESDALWLRRGHRLSDIVLQLRAAFNRWLGIGALMGVAVIQVALLGSAP